MTGTDSVNELDCTAALQAAIQSAFETGRTLDIRAGGSKRFYGRSASGEAIDVAQHSGVVSHEPTELVLTARAGTPLAAIEALLVERGQMLAFEPPHFDSSATLGGTIASGLSGPRRPYVGAARDFVLGVKLINGRGEVLTFGGQVMKNVAGYDVSRLMTGALGTLGLLLDVSLKVLPLPAREMTLVFDLDEAAALLRMNDWASMPLPLSGASYVDGRMYVRLSGSERAVEAACRQIGGDSADELSDFWRDLRDHRLPFFQHGDALWRVSLPAAAPPLGLAATTFIDWGGAQRWMRTAADADALRSHCARYGGHVTLFRGGDRSGEVFPPLDAGLMHLHRELKTAFDPKGILNPGRMYDEL